MPIYEYQCQSCDRRTEAIQRISDPPLEACDECGGALQKLLSAPAFQFKGSGWYVTDYGKGTNGKEGAKKAAADKAADGGKSDGSKSDGGKSDGSKTDGGKTDGGKTDGGKTDGGKSSGDSAASSKPPASTGASKSERIAAKTDG